VIAALVVAGSLGAWIYLKQPAHQASSPPNAYIDSAVCSNCHDDIAAKYAKTGMGRSFTTATAENTLLNFPPGNKFHHTSSDTYFTMVAHGGRYYQRRWQIGFDGKETNVDEKQVDFVIGSGNHSRTYLHLTSRNTLQVLPLSWYSEKGGYWDMSPGYDQPDYPGSIRPVHYECMFCHNAYPKIPESEKSTAGPGMTFEQPFPRGIDCQRCHGPGQRHVEIAEQSAKTEEIRAAIVNPKRLDPDREVEVCMQCHLETTSGDLPHSIKRLDRGPFTFQPGQPLGDFQIEFDQAAGNENRFQIVNAVYRLRQSQCFLKSQKNLRCTTCHDPHDVPRGPAAAEHYNGICQNCHADGLRKISSVPHTKDSDCVSCHMPKRRTDDVVHVVMTDHLIQRHKPDRDLVAPKAEVDERTGYHGEVVPYYPAPLSNSPDDALYAAAAQIRHQANLTAGLPRMAELMDKYKPSQAGFSAEIGQGYRAAGDYTKAIAQMEEAAKREPTAYRLVQLGNVQMEGRQFPQAEATLRRALSLSAESADEAVGWGTLGWTLWQENKATEARAAFEKAVALDPELPEIRNNFGSLLWGIGEQAAAEEQFREALRIQPGIAEWRLNFARVLATRGEIPEAKFQFEQTIRLKPDLADARLDYGRLLEDHGDLKGAVLELSAAIRLQPMLFRAHYELAMALGRSGDSTGAIEQLKIAASGSDAEARAAANQVLQRLGR
jgi:predicted CXXCH cytochrome family protein